MMKRLVYPDAAAVAQALAKAITSCFNESINAPAPHALMLAGGRTPKAAYQLVAESGLTIPSSVSLMISDERWVPLDHPDSNFLMMSPFMEAVGCAAAQQIMVKTALPREEAAADFGRRLDNFFQSGGILDTCFLGLGADGHTASLFSDEHLRLSEGKSAISVDRPDGRIGISATPVIIQQAKRIVFVVTGQDKKEMVRCLLTRPLEITAGKVVFRHPHVEVWMDRDAADP
jgi:6-phosphogluconolactonase